MNIKNKQIKAIKKKKKLKKEKRIVAILQSLVGIAVPHHHGGFFLLNKAVRFYESSYTC